MVYTLRFFFKCSLFHNSNLFGSCIIHILYTECAKIKKKNNSGAKILINSAFVGECTGRLKECEITSFQCYVRQQELLAPNCYQLHYCHVVGEAEGKATLFHSIYRNKFSSK